MKDLIERLEVAEAGSRELEREVEIALFGGEPSLAPDRVFRKDGLGFGYTQGFAPYTRSLDAALALAERVLAGPSVCGRPGRLHNIAQLFNGRWEAKTYRVSDGSSHEAVGAAPALALCIAILRAKDAES